MAEVEIYTDGACSGNPGPGGWAAILRWRGQEKVLTGGAAHTTNQRMEVQAAIEGLKALKRRCRVKLYTDSAYLANAYEKGWIAKWQANGWLTVKKEPVANRDLWEELWEVARQHDLQLIKVAGHADNELNNRCDQLARQAIKEELGAK